MPKSYLNPLEFDSRVVDWNIKNKFVTLDKVKAHRDSLPDDAANCEPLEIEEDEAAATGDHFSSNGRSDY